MASADEIYITIKGKGGHGALPQNCIDPIVIASNVIGSIQSIISRNCSPDTPSVLTFGKIKSVGGATNIIPNKVRIAGTFRTMDEEWRKKSHKLTKNIAKSFGGSSKVKIVVGPPFLSNHIEATQRCFEYGQKLLGRENIITLPIRMTAEDFAYYSQEIPSVFSRLSTGNTAQNITSPVRIDTFNIDEQALKIGVSWFAFMTINELHRLR